MVYYSSKRRERPTKYWTKMWIPVTSPADSNLKWVSTMRICRERWMVLLRTKRDCPLAKEWVLIWRQTTGLEVKIACSLYAVAASQSVATTYRRTKPLISRREAICTTQRASKTKEIAIQTQCRGETAFKDRLELATVACHHNTVKMHQDKVKK